MEQRMCIHKLSFCSQKNLGKSEKKSIRPARVMTKFYSTLNFFQEKKFLKLPRMFLRFSIFSFLIAINTRTNFFPVIRICKLQCLLRSGFGLAHIQKV